MVESDESPLIDNVRRYVRERLVPLEFQVEDDDAVPSDVVEEMREMGFFGMTLPEEYGGLGLSLVDEVKVIFEVTFASLAFRSTFAMNIGVGSHGLLASGTEAQKDAWLPRIASGEIVSAFCLTEPDSGSDSAALRTRAERDGDDYVINGTKRYISNAPIAGLFTVMARTSEEKLPGNRHVSAFLVPADTPGVSVGAKDRKMGQRGALTADVNFDNVRVPAANLIGGAAGLGFAMAMKVLDRGRIGVAAAAVGQAKRLLDDALRFAVERRQFGKPIGEFQLVQAMLADSKAEIYAAESMVLNAAASYDAGRPIGTEASCCKMFATEMASRVADRTIQIFGGAGYMKDSGVERFARDVRVLRIYEGTTQIQQLVIARNLLRQAGLRRGSEG